MSLKKKSSSFQVPIRKQGGSNDEEHVLASSKKEQEYSSSLVSANSMFATEDVGGSSPPMDNEEDHETIMLEDDSESELPVITSEISQNSLVISQDTFKLPGEEDNENEVIMVKEDDRKQLQKTMSQPVKQHALSQPEKQQSLYEPDKKHSLSQPANNAPVKPKFVQKFNSKPLDVNTGFKDVKKTNTDDSCVQSIAPSHVKKTSSSSGKPPKNMEKKKNIKEGHTAKVVMKTKKEMSYPDEYYKKLFDVVIMKAMSMSVEKSNVGLLKEVTEPQCADESPKEADVPHEAAAAKVNKPAVVLQKQATQTLEKSPRQSSLSQKSDGSLPIKVDITTPVLKRFSTPKRLTLPDNQDVTPQKIKKITETGKISQGQSQLSQASQLSQTHRSQFSQSQRSGSSQLLFSPLPVNLTPKSQLSWIEERRDVGVWVQCEMKHCHKWRYLADTKDPLDVPHYWVCSMHPDPQFSSCDMPEKGPTPLQEEDLIHNRYTSGSIVWARVQGFPWWPAMICDCPDYLQYYWLNYFSDIPTDYHVVFFDSKNVPVTRAWLKPKFLHPYAGFEKTKTFKPSGKDRYYSERIAAAKKMAEDAMKVSVLERRKKYSFLARYNGPIGKKENQFSSRDVAPYAGSQLLFEDSHSSDVFAEDDDKDSVKKKKLKKKLSKFQKQKK